jgi:hypothetical protein
VRLLLLLVDQVSPNDLVVRDLDGVAAGADDHGLLAGVTCRPIALRKCSGVRTGRSIPGEETSIAYSRR